MGYTHYFEVVGQAPTDKEWEEITSRIEREVFREHEEWLCEEFDLPDSPPIANLENVFFNGRGNDGHETFVVSRDMQGFNFCKTAEKPYDTAVVESLKIIKQVCPNWLKLASDGDEPKKNLFVFS